MRKNIPNPYNSNAFLTKKSKISLKYNQYVTKLERLRKYTQNQKLGNEKNCIISCLCECDRNCF